MRSLSLAKGGVRPAQDLLMSGQNWTQPSMPTVWPVSTLIGVDLGDVRRAACCVSFSHTDLLNFRAVFTCGLWFILCFSSRALLPSLDDVSFLCVHTVGQIVLPSKVPQQYFQALMHFRTLPLSSRNGICFPLLEVEWDFVILLMNKVWRKSSYMTEKLGPRRWYGFQLVLTGALSLCQDVWLWNIASIFWESSNEPMLKTTWRCPCA